MDSATPEINMNKLHLVGSGVAEMPQDGRRYRFHIERYRHDDGSEFGRIVSMEEIPDVGPYLWIPSWGADPQETEHLFDEAMYEREHPHPLDSEWLGQHRHEQQQRMKMYNELRDKRAELVKRNYRTLGARR